MPDLNCVKNGPYPFLSRFDTETLRQILRDNFELEDSGALENDELITCVMGVIAQREENDPRNRKFDVNAGRRDFQQNYQPTEEDMAQIHDPTASNEFIRNNKQGKQATLKTSQPKRAVHRILRIMASLCMIAVRLPCIPTIFCMRLWPALNTAQKLLCLAIPIAGYLPQHQRERPNQYL